MMEEVLEAAVSVPSAIIQSSARAMIKTYFIDIKNPGFSKTLGYQQNWEGFLEHCQYEKSINKLQHKSSDEKLAGMMGAKSDLHGFLKTLQMLDFLKLLAMDDLTEGFQKLLKKDIKAFNGFFREPIDVEYEYDAFVAYAEDDLPYVKNVFLRQLEETGMKLYLKDRNMNAGDPIFPALVEMMHRKAKKVLLLVSQNFNNCEMCAYQKQYALYLEPTALMRKIAIVLIEKECSIPAEFKILQPINLTEKDNCGDNILKLTDFLGLKVTKESPMFTWAPYQRQLSQPRDLSLQCPSIPTHEHHAFISYASDVKLSEIKQMFSYLEEDPINLKLYIYDRDSIPGQFIYDQMAEAISNSEKFILLLSPKYVKTEACYFQLWCAMIQSPGGKGKPIIPIKYKHPCNLPNEIRQIESVDLEDLANRAEGMRRLEKALAAPLRVWNANSIEQTAERYQETRQTYPAEGDQRMHSYRPSPEQETPRQPQENSTSFLTFPTLPVVSAINGMSNSIEHNRDGSLQEPIDVENKVHTIVGLELKSSYDESITIAKKMAKADIGSNDSNHTYVE